MIASLVNEAIKLNAPFTQTTVGRLHGEIFGSGRAARSSDILVFNAADTSLHLHSTGCEWGGYSSNLFPETVIPAKKSSVFGIESNGFLSGVTCNTKYKSSDGNSWVFFHVDNPYIGHNVIYSRSSSDLTVVETLGQGNNNQVRFLIRNSERS